MNGSLHVDWCSHEAAKFAVLNWHYSRVMPAAKLIRIGVWENGSFVGVIIYSCGACKDLNKLFGVSNLQVCELTRIALRKHEFPVSKMVAQSLRMLKRKCPGLKVVVSYADPHQGHTGQIYKAGNWIYTGKTKPERFPILEGRVSHSRTLAERIENGWKVKRSEIHHVKRPGKYRYVMPLDDDIRPAIEAMRKEFCV